VAYIFDLIYFLKEIQKDTETGKTHHRVDITLMCPLLIAFVYLIINPENVRYVNADLDDVDGVCVRQFKL